MFSLHSLGASKTVVDISCNTDYTKYIDQHFNDHSFGIVPNMSVTHFVDHFDSALNRGFVFQEKKEYDFYEKIKIGFISENKSFQYKKDDLSKELNSHDLGFQSEVSFLISDIRPKVGFGYIECNSTGHRFIKHTYILGIHYHSRWSRNYNLLGIKLVKEIRSQSNKLELSLLLNPRFYINSKTILFPLVTFSYVHPNYIHDLGLSLRRKITTNTTCGTDFSYGFVMNENGVFINTGTNVYNLGLYVGHVFYEQYYMSLFYEYDKNIYPHKKSITNRINLKAEYYIGI